MTGSLHLTGFCDSVYTRAVRLALAEAGAAYDCTEVDPFTPGCAAALTGLQPFGRVPVVRHGAFVLHETAAILGYVSDACAGQALMPRTPQARARVWQATGIIDSYGYLPLVRQVRSLRGERPAACRGTLCRQAFLRQLPVRLCR